MAMNPTYKWVRFQQLQIIPHLEAVERGEIDRLAIFMPPGHLLAHDTLVPTPQGWREHGDLEVGDYVFDQSGAPVMVTNRSQVFGADIRVTLSNGEEFYAHENHEWRVFDRTSDRWKYLGTKYFLKETKFSKARCLRSAERGIYQLPLKNAVQYPEKQLALHPYALGAWLGDGTSAGSKITFPEKDRAIIERIESLGYKKSAEWIHKTTGILTASFGGERFIGGGPFIKGLNAYRLLRHKHIPEAYKRASIEQRLQLISGLIDTDGHKDKARGRYRIVTTNKELADDIEEVILSLGWNPCVSVGKLYNPEGATIISKQTPYYVGFSPDRALPVALERKRLTDLATRRRQVYIAEVERVGGNRIGRCIEIENPNGLYLVGKSYAATSNSKTDLATRTFIPWFMGRNPSKNAMVCSYSADLASDDFGASIKARMNSALYSQTFPGAVLTRDSRSKTSFTTKSGGHFYSVGFGGGVTGKRLDLIVLDDLIKNKAEAESDAVQQDLFDTYRAVIKDRLRPRSAIVMCVARGQRVVMADGTWRAIEEIKSGDSILSFDKVSTAPVKKLVLDAWSNGEAKTLKIVSRSIETRVTGNHPFLICRGTKRDWSLQWVKAQELNLGDYIVTLKSKLPAAGYRPTLFGHKADQSFYWLLGFLYGDGWLIRDKSRGLRGCAVAKSIYPELNNRVKEAYTKCFRHDLRETKFGYWRDDSPLIARLLFSLGFGGSAKTKTIPDWVFRLRPCDIRSFLRGYLDADGYHREAKTGHNQTYRAVSVNRELLDQMRLLARVSGVRTTKIFKQVYRSPSPKRNLPRATVGYFEEFSFLHDATELGTIWQNQKYFRKYFRFEKVEQIDNAPSTEVFDLTIADTANFIVEGAVVHNCMHRWLINDVAGRVLAMDGRIEEGGRWTVLNLPAEDPPNSGRFLWEDHYGRDYYLEFKKDDDTWASKFQQDPQAQSGYKFKEEWLEFYENPPPPGRFKSYMFCDPAASKAKSSDFTVINVFCPAQERKLLLVDWVWDRLDPGERTDAMLRLCRKWNPQELYYETYGLNADIFYLNEAMREGNFPPNAYARAVGKSGPGHNNSKEVRIDALIPYYRRGLIVLPRHFERDRYDGTRIDYTEKFIEKEYKLYRGKKSIPHEDNLDCQSRIVDPAVRIDYELPQEQKARAERPIRQGSSWYAVY